MLGWFAQSALSEMQRILRGAQDNKRRLQHDNDIGISSNRLSAPGYETVPSHRRPSGSARKRGATRWMACVSGCAPNPPSGALVPTAGCGACWGNFRMGAALAGLRCGGLARARQ